MRVRAGNFAERRGARREGARSSHCHCHLSGSSPSIRERVILTLFLSMELKRTNDGTWSLGRSHPKMEANKDAPNYSRWGVGIWEGKITAQFMA